MSEDLQNQFFTIIDSAVASQRVIQLKHNNQWRTIEPYMVGLHSETQVPCLYGFCRDVMGDSPRWQFFMLSEIRNMELTNYSFQPHLEYEGSHTLLKSIYIKLKVKGFKEPKKITQKFMAV